MIPWVYTLHDGEWSRRQQTGANPQAVVRLEARLTGRVSGTVDPSIKDRG